jgi:flagellar basal-body rod protein FlgF
MLGKHNINQLKFLKSNLYYLKMYNKHLFLRKMVYIIFTFHLCSSGLLYATNLTPYILLASKMANKKKVAVEVNNLCNNNSIGFRKDKSLIQAKKKNKCTISMPLVESTYIDEKEGGTKITSRKLDIAIVGYGYFKVLTQNGVRYTLDGAMEINEDGNLVNKFGDLFLDVQDREINVIPNFSDITFTSAGDIFVSLKGVQTNIGKLAVVAPINPLTLLKEGNNLIINSGDEIDALNYTIFQGSLNLSNVDTVKTSQNIKQCVQEFKKSDNLMYKIFHLYEKETNKLSHSTQ